MKRDGKGSKKHSWLCIKVMHQLVTHESSFLIDDGWTNVAPLYAQLSIIIYTYLCNKEKKIQGGVRCLVFLPATVSVCLHLTNVGSNSLHKIPLKYIQKKKPAKQESYPTLMCNLLSLRQSDYMLLILKAWMCCWIIYSV